MLGDKVRYIHFVGIVWLFMASLCHAAEEPVLVRVSFWVSLERHVEFDAAYQEHFAPILKQHGFVASPRNETLVGDKRWAVA